MKSNVINININFARVEVENLGSVGGGDGDEARRIHFTGDDALLPDQHHPFLHAIDSIRNLRKIIFTFKGEPKTVLISVRIDVPPHTTRFRFRRRV